MWKPLKTTPEHKAFVSISHQVEKQLFDYLSEPGCILQAMGNHSFDRMLEHYFSCGKDDKEATLHLAGRLRGSHNLLHTCFSAGVPKGLIVALILPGMIKVDAWKGGSTT